MSACRAKSWTCLNFHLQIFTMHSFVLTQGCELKVNTKACRKMSTSMLKCSFTEISHTSVLWCEVTDKKFKHLESDTYINTITAANLPHLPHLLLFSLLCRRSCVIQRSSGGTDELARSPSFCERLGLRWRRHPQVFHYFLLLLFSHTTKLLHHCSHPPSLLFPSPCCCLVTMVKA